MDSYKTLAQTPIRSAQTDRPFKAFCPQLQTRDRSSRHGLHQHTYTAVGEDLLMEVCQQHETLSFPQTQKSFDASLPHMEVFACAEDAINNDRTANLRIRATDASSQVFVAEAAASIAAQAQVSVRSRDAQMYAAEAATMAAIVTQTQESIRSRSRDAAARMFVAEAESVAEAMKESVKEKRRVELLETENSSLKSQLIAMSAESKALSKALQERAKTIAAVRTRQDEAEIAAVALRAQIDCLHKDMDAQRYQIRLLKKDLRLKNDEREDRKTETEAANRKMAVLESECHRLRRLLRQKSRPDVHYRKTMEAADSQTNNVVSCCIDGSKTTKNKANPCRLPASATASIIHSDPYQHLHKQIQALTERLASMEEENQLLKETLVQRTNELESANRQICWARTAMNVSSAQSLLYHGHGYGGRVLPHTGTGDTLSITTMDDYMQRTTADMSDISSRSDHSGEVGDRQQSAVAESWALALMSELSLLGNQDDAKHGDSPDSENRTAEQLEAAAASGYGESMPTVRSLNDTTVMMKRLLRHLLEALQKSQANRHGYNLIEVDTEQKKADNKLGGEFEQKLCTEEVTHDTMKLEQMMACTEGGADGTMDVKLEQKTYTDDTVDVKLQQEICTDDTVDVKLQQEICTDDTVDVKLEQKTCADDTVDVKLEQKTCTDDTVDVKLEQKTCTDDTVDVKPEPKTCTEEEGTMDAKLEQKTCTEDSEQEADETTDMRRKTCKEEEEGTMDVELEQKACTEEEEEDEEFEEEGSMDVELEQKACREEEGTIDVELEQKACREEEGTIDVELEQKACTEDSEEETDDTIEMERTKERTEDSRDVGQKTCAGEEGTADNTMDMDGKTIGTMEGKTMDMEGKIRR